MSTPGTTPTGAKTNRRGFWLRAGGTIVTLALLVLLIRQQGWAAISAAVQQVDSWRIWASLGLMLISRTAVSFRWHMLLREVDQRASLANSLRITYAGLFAANFLPTTIGGDVVRLAACLQLQYNAEVSTASLVVDRLVGMAGMAMVLPWGLASLAQSGLPGITTAPSEQPSLLALAWAGRLWERTLGFVRGMLKHFQLWFKHPRGLALSLLFTFIHQACLYASIQLMLVGMGETVGWMQIAGIWSLVYFITLLPISINGYGLQEISTTLLYAHLCGISIEVAAAVALLQRFVQMVASLPGAFFVPGIVAAPHNAGQEEKA